jgi:hypothetical protein
VKLRPTIVVVASVATVTACGGGAPAIYAGMTADEAASQALDAAAQDAKRPKDLLHGRDLRLKRVVRGEYDARDAWAVVLDIGSRDPVCVWIWAEQRVMSTTYTYSVDECTPKVLKAKADIVAP